MLSWLLNKAVCAIVGENEITVEEKPVKVLENQHGTGTEEGSSVTFNGFQGFEHYFAEPETLHGAVTMEGSSLVLRLKYSCKGSFNERFEGEYKFVNEHPEVSPVKSGESGGTGKRRTETEALKEIEERLAPSTPVDSLLTPSPPAYGARSAIVAAKARAAQVSPPTHQEPEYCSFRAKYTKAEKEAAKEWKLAWGYQSTLAAKVAAGLGATAAAMTAAPEPAVSKTMAAIWGVASATCIRVP